ncbi:MAG: single-stranded DNA-binding protein [Alicyclobacillus herbarius]|uniref:single-stranded DNA-binding protein n=1 Tax=Alicyclobacillus herbarius TaxID=122960 RepID=UPI002355BFF9|nr:single-stranded DNA-binding protein [Alicyclobacillus herbarius]MCL6633340.1 single-stranded DNA-binding protein [Alicyclobacillus herbarius]
MLNRVVLIGRLTADPILRYTQSGTAVGSFTLAVNRMHTNQNGEQEADFINIVTWGKTAENCAQYLHKGRLAAVDGRLQIRSYENREGQRVRVAEVVAQSVRFLERSQQNHEQQKSNSRGGQAAKAPQAGSDSYGDDPFADDPFADDLPTDAADAAFPF